VSSAGCDIAIVTGGRDYMLTEQDRRWLDQMLEEQDFRILLHGAAKGADAGAAEWARSRGLCDAGCPAQWEEFRRRTGSAGRAGPDRNRRIAHACRPPVRAICLAFPGGRGTANMISFCRHERIPVLPSPSRAALEHVDQSSGQ
jgi:hypothetical protein